MYVVIDRKFNEAAKVYSEAIGKTSITIAPYGSEFSQGVCISIFIFYVLALYLRNFSEFHCIVLMYVTIILLRNKRCRSNQKRVAEMISQ